MTQYSIYKTKKQSAGEALTAFSGRPFKVVFYGLFHVEVTDFVHVAIVKIFAAHTPDEHIV